MNTPCQICGRTDEPLHFNRQCPLCFVESQGQDAIKQMDCIETDFNAYLENPDRPHMTINRIYIMVDLATRLDRIRKTHDLDTASHVKMITLANNLMDELEDAMRIVTELTQKEVQ